MIPARLGSHLMIHLDRFKKNIESIQNHCPKNKILLMVKADAYGHGLSEIVDYSFRELGINEFGVATLGEALTLRRNFPEAKFEIYVFSDLQLGLDTLKEQYIENRLIPVISHFDDLNNILEDKSFSNLPICLKFNTGMNRLGLHYEKSSEVIELLKRHQRKEIFHFMSHMANGSMPMETNKRNKLKQTISIFLITG